jgi:hypothetical protein
MNIRLHSLEIDCLFVPEFTSEGLTEIVYSFKVLLGELLTDWLDGSFLFQAFLSLCSNFVFFSVALEESFVFAFCLFDPLQSTLTIISTGSSNHSCLFCHDGMDDALMQVPPLCLVAARPLRARTIFGLLLFSLLGNEI